MQPYYWDGEPGEDQDREVIAPGKENIWLCELGRREVDGEFGDFISRIRASRLEFSGLNITFHSPSQGQLDFGWTGPLRQGGTEIPLSDYPRYDNPYVYADFPCEKLTIRKGDDFMHLSWFDSERQVCTVSANNL